MYDIYANIWGILMGSMLPSIAAPWILWVYSWDISNINHNQPPHILHMSWSTRTWRWVLDPIDWVPWRARAGPVRWLGKSLQLWSWLSVITGYFYGIIYSISMGLVLIIGISGHNCMKWRHSVNLVTIWYNVYVYVMVMLQYWDVPILVGGFKHEWIIVHNIWDVILPIDYFHIFQNGYCTTNQHLFSEFRDNLIQYVCLCNLYEAPKIGQWFRTIWVAFYLSIILGIAVRYCNFDSNSRTIPMDPTWFSHTWEGMLTI